ncbi:MAG: 4-hydroxybenzoate 3-monooxygenase [Pseudolabrys sp.]|nr:4-hydroxybenzoate 3-monooxygenase [Pseudolabrys sp.]
MRTQVGIIGAGPAGLMLAHLLRRAGIESIIVENRSREYCEARVRAGLIEQWARDMLIETGVGERLKAEGLFHKGIKLQFDGVLHEIKFTELVGKGTTIYGQQEVVKDLIDDLLRHGVPILFEVSGTRISDLDTKQPKIHFMHEGKAQQIECDFIGGCDGFHGICRPSVPDGKLTFYDREYPFGWLGILSESANVDEELIYSYHDRGFALYTQRSPTVSRLYFQCAPDEDAGNWTDEAIWEELRLRLGGVCPLPTGPILQKSVTPMRSFVTEPMQYGRLFLAGDSAHIVPPTGAKGMNLALADVLKLSRALAHFYKTGQHDRLDGYSAEVLPRVWKAQRFSWWMTSLLHHFPHENAFDRRRQVAELDYVATSRAAAMTLAENYAGLPID